jgi:hypothetical protein
MSLRILMCLGEFLFSWASVSLWATILGDHKFHLDHKPCLLSLIIHSPTHITFCGNARYSWLLEVNEWPHSTPTFVERISH